MCTGLLSQLKNRCRSSSSPKDHSTANRKHSPDLLENLSELATPPPVENHDDVGLYRHHTLEENLRRNSRGEEPENADEDVDILVRHHTLEENIKLARELSAEMKRQLQELEGQRENS